MPKTKYGDIIHRLEDGIAFLTINRPQKLNSMTTNTLWELRQAITEADADEDTKIIILTGSGEQAFSTGFDVVNVPKLSIVESRQLHIRNSVLTKALMGIGKPIIAAANGMALGAGFEISLLCDLTVAAESATFGMPELAIGAYPGTIAPALLWHLVGVKKAKELLLTCRRIGAHEAASLGLVNEVVPDDKLMERTLQLANEIMGMAPLPMTIFKARMNSMLRVLLEEEMSRFVEVQALVFDTLDFREGLDALKEKRKPIFRGH
ncbi:MAG TPA: enoyl-CoA hydratase/isomerase family protein [Syntrophorhabdales bacterium]|nr:enoyl-CoA hydratase/isomerase family protein [Syntrophorhabdales bacterium]